jgi:hypothetical protein
MVLLTILATKLNRANCGGPYYPSTFVFKRLIEIWGGLVDTLAPLKIRAVDIFSGCVSPCLMGQLSPKLWEESLKLQRNTVYLQAGAGPYRP